LTQYLSDRLLPRPVCIGVLSYFIN